MLSSDQAVDEVGLRSLQGQLDRVFVDDLVGLDPGHARGEDRLLVGDAFERVLDVAGLDLLAVVVLDALAQMEDVGLVVGVLPFLGQIRQVLQIGTVAHQRVEHAQPDDVVVDQRLIGVRVGRLDVVGRGDGHLRGDPGRLGRGRRGSRRRRRGRRGSGGRRRGRRRLGAAVAGGVVGAGGVAPWWVRALALG